MAKRKTNTRTDQKTPTSARLADTGISTGADFSRVMAALLADTIAGRIEPQRANASCNVAGKLIRMVELQHKYGRQVEGSRERLLELTPMSGTAASESIQ
jgi:hypothetical protein